MYTWPSMCGESSSRTAVLAYYHGTHNVTAKMLGVIGIWSKVSIIIACSHFGPLAGTGT
jgi:hypothetical protein